MNTTTANRIATLAGAGGAMLMAMATLPNVEDFARAAVAALALFMFLLAVSAARAAGEATSEAGQRLRRLALEDAQQRVARAEARVAELMVELATERDQALLSMRPDAIAFKRLESAARAFLAAQGTTKAGDARTDLVRALELLRPRPAEPAPPAPDDVDQDAETQFLNAAGGGS